MSWVGGVSLAGLKMFQKNVLVALAAGLGLTSAFLLPTPTRSVSRLQAADG
jgi:hypothetical protein